MLASIAAVLVCLAHNRNQPMHCCLHVVLPAFRVVPVETDDYLNGMQRSGPNRLLHAVILLQCPEWCMFEGATQRRAALCEFHIRNYHYLPALHNWCVSICVWAKWHVHWLQWDTLMQQQRTLHTAAAAAIQASSSVIVASQPTLAADRGSVAALQRPFHLSSAAHYAGVEQCIIAAHIGSCRVTQGNGRAVPAGQQRHLCSPGCSRY